MNVMMRFFNILEKKNIKYVHFKSNSNLDLSFQAKADFDVLVDKRYQSEVTRALIECDAKEFNKPRYGVYPGVANWLLFDEDSGNIYHLHLHYQLASGKKLLKEYVLPWDDLLFQTRIKDDEFSIYISSPEMELILLTARMVIKSHLIDYIKAYVGLYKTYPSLQSEHQDLVKRTNSVILTKIAHDIVHFTNGNKFAEIAMKPVWGSSDFLTINKMVRKELAHYRRFSCFSSIIKSSILSFGDKYNKFLRRVVGVRRIENKVTSSGGLIIAFVGVDGAGKSTTKDTIYKWMKSQIECKRFYMGTGDGKVNIFAKLAKKIGSLSAGKEKSETKTGEGSQLFSIKHDPKQYIRKICAALMVYSVERNNYKKMLTMNRYRLEGGISLLDRYPQIEIEGQNDGPKIIVYRRQLDKSILLDKLCKKEKKLLGIVREIKPDVVFRLNIAAETSMKRKSEQKDIIVFKKKIEQLNKITFQNAYLIDIDAEQNYQEEVLCIKKKIWELF